MSLVSMIKPKGPNGFGSSSTAEDVSQGVDMTGKIILVTGCNSGLGLETARVLALRGAHIIGLARTLEKAEVALSQFKGAKTTAIACELSDPKSIREAIQAIKSLHLKLDSVICNAGIMALPRLEKDHGYERQFFTNHMGHFILVTGLLDQLAAEGRVIVLSSSAHEMAPKGGIDFENLKGEKSYKPWTAYGQAKMANLVFAKELARRFQGSGKTCYAVHPGVIATNLGRNMNPLMDKTFRLAKPLFLKSIPQGAATQVYLAVTKNPGAESGAYFADCNPKTPRADAMNPELGRKLWQVSDGILEKL
jgi:WW domain-containing oxidoreductase